MNGETTRLDNLRREKIELGEWQTRETISLYYSMCQVIISIPFEWSGKTLKCCRLQV
jgi:hypothetical protein